MKQRRDDAVEMKRARMSQERARGGAPERKKQTGPASFRLLLCFDCGAVLLWILTAAARVFHSERLQAKEHRANKPAGAAQR